jgi:uncharacterized membrane protein
LAFAERYDCVVVFRRSVGEFVSVGDPILEIQGATPPAAACEQLHGLIAIGVGRTVEHDPAFAIRIMVDIATRALSADATDPTSAVQVMGVPRNTSEGRPGGWPGRPLILDAGEGGPAGRRGSR